MHPKLILVFCIFGFLFVLALIPGSIMIFFPHKVIDSALKIYDRFGFLGVDRSDLGSNAHSSVAATFYRAFGLALIVVFALPLLALFFSCVLQECQIR